MCLASLLAENVPTDLCGGDPFVAEELLDDDDVHAIAVQRRYSGRDQESGRDLMIKAGHVIRVARRR